MAGRDITEGRGNEVDIARAFADIGIVSTDAVWQNTNISYDMAVAGMPFIAAISDKNPATRETAPFRKLPSISWQLTYFVEHGHSLRKFDSRYAH